MAKKDKYAAIVVADFYEAIAGWIHFKIKIGNEVFEQSFSEVFDPIIDLKNWLEAISTNVQQTSFTFDPEGNKIKFDIIKVDNVWADFIISEPYEDDKIHIESTVNRKQLVKAFYWGLVKFSKSKEYNHRKWEVCYYKERLCENLQVDETELLEKLKQLKRIELIEKLFEANPMHQIENFKTNNKVIIDGEEKHITLMKMDISKDYDNWTEKAKEKLIVETMNKKVSGFCGTKLSEFQSDMIEEYLSK